ncbi:hypothetical protein [Pleionea litopenaei]|uniref:Uncharacterized protein n=1 Tax=Pleionea litopenaei TaxID=3070815 RepID=A0AA51X6Z8_9GAMM|nr:hypothetical protein [Pleionea sp. HL-JVS1]WMS86590.1 hypothetical protein Q9312_15320 [Pleionea sp. HL-JVS1]
MKSDLNEALKFVKKRPGMYLRAESIYELATFIAGYEVALRMNFEYPNPDNISFMNWVEEKYEICNPAWHWSRILHHVAGTEVEALHLFFTIWPEYYEIKSRFISNRKSIKFGCPKESVTNDYWNRLHEQQWSS